MPPALYALPVEGKGLSCGHPPGMRARSQSTEGGVSGIIMQFVIVHLIHLYEDALLYGFLKEKLTLSVNLRIILK